MRRILIVAILIIVAWVSGYYIGITEVPKKQVVVKKKTDPALIEKLINIERERLNLQTLDHNPNLCPYAELRSVEIKYNFNHRSKERLATDRELLGLNAIGENIAMSFNDEQSLVNSWLKSPKHFEVLSGKYYKNTCVKVYENNFVVQIFSN